MKGNKILEWFYYLNLICSISLSFVVCARSESEHDETVKTSKQPTYTIGIYMAARNDLFPFAGRNIKQMQQVGSNERVKICIHFDMHKPGQNRITKRFFVEKERIMQLGPDLSMDSGDVNSLIDFAKCLQERYPSDEYIIILWNHGTGPIEPALQRGINPSELFTYNPKNRLIELNRSVGFLDHITQGKTEFEDTKGILIDDSSGRYLTNQQLREGLETITKDIFKKKIAILACDACHMASLEVMSPIKDYVKYFVGSQEVELGTGYNYTALLEPFLSYSPDIETLACHFVACYKNAYSKITQDFTHSAVNLTKIDLLEQNVDQLANLLLYGLQNQKQRSVREAIRISRHKNFCTIFNEPTYVDLGHFYTNLLNNMHKCELSDPQETTTFRKNLSEILTTGNSLIQTVVIANTVGRNLQYAKGIFIYFPEIRIHKSYPKTDFALRTSWLQFLRAYLVV